MIESRPLPDAALLCRLLHYDRGSGDLFWCRRPLSDFSAVGDHKKWNARYAGTRAGSKNTSGAVQVRIHSVHFLAHRLIWKIVTGADPREEIDHMNCVPDDNRWLNLREAARQQNLVNRRAPRKYSLPRGVRMKGSSISAEITIHGSRIYLGTFQSIDDAKEAYCSAAREWFGEFARAK